MTQLQGVGVLVTRPEQQALRLADLFESAGATVVRFPTIHIVGTVDSQASNTRIGFPTALDLCIFTSANAVAHGAHLVCEHFPVTIAALGPATARALRDRGLRVDLVPTQSFDSEGLLLRPEFESLSGRHVLIVKGTGGRTHLERELTRRGACVHIADVYSRERVIHPAEVLATLTARFASCETRVATATSLEIALSLIASATPGLRTVLNSTAWLAPSERVATALREHGMKPIITARSADDHDLVDAVCRWRASVSGA